MATVAVVSLPSATSVSEVSVEARRLQTPTFLPDLAILQPSVQVPFTAIGKLFDHLQANPALAARLNQIYPARGLFKNAATKNPISDQKLTIDLSPTRISRIPVDLQASLMPHGFTEALDFFNAVTRTYLDSLPGTLSKASFR